jgi:hypothetical protein
MLKRKATKINVGIERLRKQVGCKEQYQPLGPLETTVV